MLQKYADIIIDISHEAIDRTFQYKIPENLISKVEIGKEVFIPFGNGNRKRKGYVIGISDMPHFDVEKIKEIIDISSKGIPIEEKLIKLAFHMKSKYGGTTINALNTVMPVKKIVKKTKKAAILDKEKSQKEDLEKKQPVVLNQEQSNIINQIILSIKENPKEKILLHGITASGKTEIYIYIIKEMIKNKRQTILLIPEIGLIYQTLERLKIYFDNRISIISSKMSDGEKFREFTRVMNNEVDVIIGPRTALFAPFDNLGLIIVDEEHDNAYKSESTPKYHSRDIALVRGNIENAAVILASATPSVESYYKASKGEYKLFKLNNRVMDFSLGKTHVVDMRDELAKGNRSIISNKLYDLIKDRLEKKQQIILFLNRRGHSRFISCRKCGQVVKCPNCDVSLTKNNEGSLICNYCGYKKETVSSCSNCGSNMIGGFGAGTQKVEEEINKLFPDAVTLRMDKDTTVKKDSHEEILNRFLQKKADILVGTQMIVKGHDFNNVTLVGVILADITLFESDYLAGERTFDLLTQAAGRTGRSDIKGDVVIQTYQPDNYIIQAAANQSYEEFFEMEIGYRKLLKYPPVYEMMLVLLVSKNQEELIDFSKTLKNYIVEYFKEDKSSRVYGPSNANIYKINNNYRLVIYIKNKDIGRLIDIKECLETKYINNSDKQEINIYMDINPSNIY